MELIAKAKALATKAHEGQVRKTDGTPYIHHPVAVAEIVREAGFADVVIAAALTHDVLEDTPVTEAELRAELGDEVIDIVTAVSEDKALPWEDRKTAYIAAVANAAEGVKAVSVADKIHNAESLIKSHQEQGPIVWQAFNRGKEKKVWFEASLHEALRESWQHPLLERYGELVEQLKNLAD